MLERERISDEPVSRSSLDDAALGQWLGAIFELEGSLYFSQELYQGTRVRRVVAGPVVRLIDTNRSQLELVHARSKSRSGTIIPSENNSHSLTIIQKDAARIGKRIAPYAPSRKTATDHFIWWLEARGLDEKAEVASSYARGHEAPLVSHEEYAELLQYPAFVAGLIDLRGNLFESSYQEFFKNRNKSYWRHRKWMTFYTTKVNLLRAMREKFIGGTPKLMSGRTYGWKVEGDDLAHLLNFAGEYVQGKSGS